MTQNEEFRCTVEYLHKCIGTVACGCSMTDEDVEMSEYLFLACKMYVACYKERFEIWK